MLAAPGNAHEQFVVKLDLVVAEHFEHFLVRLALPELRLDVLAQAVVEFLSVHVSFLLSFFVLFQLLKYASYAIENQDGLKISSIIAIIEGRGERHKQILSTRLDNTVEFDLPTDVYGGHIEASVVVVYKIGVFKSKEIKVRVSKNF